VIASEDDPYRFLAPLMIESAFMRRVSWAMDFEMASYDAVESFRRVEALRNSAAEDACLSIAEYSVYSANPVCYAELDSWRSIDALRIRATEEES